MSDPSLCDRLLTPRTLLSLILRRSLTHPQLRCLQHGKDLHPSAYLTATTTGRGQHIEVADMRRLGCLRCAEALAWSRRIRAHREQFFCASEASAVVPILSLNSAEAFDSGVLLGPKTAERLIDHARQCYAAA
jgi:hypothetical protein